jgi:predicted nucleic acid-binding protein
MSRRFADDVMAALAVAEDMPVTTFDSDFRRFPDVRMETE